MAVRRQVTLYLTAPCCDRVEAIRSRFNPEQARLIRAHVTLCREDEVADWDELETRLVRLNQISVDLTFDEIIRDGDLVFLAATGVQSSFEKLRELLLSTESSVPRHHRPHLTLIHPRNGRCDDQTFVELEDSFKPFSVRLNRVTIIEQINGGPWRDVIDFLT